MFKIISTFERMYDEIVLKKLGKLFIVLLNECDSTEYEKISRKDLVKLI